MKNLASFPPREHPFCAVSRFGTLLLLGLLLTVLGGQPAAAQFQDVGYTFEPGVQGVFEEPSAAVQNGPLYGGALGLSFGRYFQASAEYFANTGLTTDFSNFDRLNGLLDREIGVQRYGARLRFNLYDRRVIPYLTVGSGVLRFEPEEADASRTIYGLAGGGITFSAYDRYRISVGGEVLSYRYDPVATFLGPSGAQNFGTGTTLVASPALTASLALFLGGRSLEEQTAVDQALQEQFGGGGLFRGVRLFVNPFQGRVEFNDALGFPKDQNFAGVNAGVSLGPYVGLRGFYWRGREGSTVLDDFAGGFENIQMYGGELQLRLNLNLGRGFVPYAKVGGGYLDVLGRYVEDIPAGTTPPEDRFFGTTGVGLEVPFTRSVKLSGGARALLMSNPNVAEAGDPGDIYGSLMYTAGIEFRLGGGAERPTPTPGTERPTPGSSAPGPRATTRSAPTSTETPLLARVDSLERALAALRSDTTTASPAPPPRSNLSDRTMTVPVPEEGELYIRFGDGTTTTAGTPPVAGTRPAGDLPADVEQRVQETLRRQLRQQVQGDTARALTDADLERLVEQTVRNALRQQQATTSQREQTAQAQKVERLQDQVNALQRRLREREADASPEPPAPPSETSPFYREVLGRPLTYLVPIAGFRGGEGDNQLHVGVRGDYRTSATARLHLVPELSFGVGGGSLAPTLLVNAAYTGLRATTADLLRVPLEPYVGAGLGFASTGGFTFEPVTNVMVGVDYPLRGAQRLFLEYSTLDLFDIHRVHLGVRVRL